MLTVSIAVRLSLEEGCLPIKTYQYQEKANGNRLSGGVTSNKNLHIESYRWVDADDMFAMGLSLCRIYSNRTHETTAEIYSHDSSKTQLFGKVDVIGGMLMFSDGCVDSITHRPASAMQSAI